MSFHAWLNFLVLIVLAVAFASLARALWTGRLKTDGRLLLRAEAPADYWFEFAMLLLILLVLCWPVLIPPLMGQEEEFPSFGAAVLAAFGSAGFLRSLRNRKTDFFGKPLQRAERPGPYWALTFFKMILAAAGFAAMFSS